MTSLTEAIDTAQALADQLTAVGIPAALAGDPFNLGAAEVPLALGDQPFVLFAILADAELTWYLTDETTGDTVADGTFYNITSPAEGASCVRRIIAAYGAQLACSDGPDIASGDAARSRTVRADNAAAIS